ncbi:hypothetical protein KC717_00180, partial [Candidatus Dojkabacteria bacterium]|nr:hypothetical protein [Candidatus Dojkabacteria bacterium]
ENFEQLGISADISTATVFPAMNDSGPLTYPHFRENIFKNGESIICIGTGNIKRLHSDHECLTPDTLMLAMVQYKGLLQELLIECIHQKGSV